MLNEFNEVAASHQQFTQTLRKITDEATNRMLTRTAKEQYKLAMDALNKEEIPDADDSSINRKHLM